MPAPEIEGPVHLSELHIYPAADSLYVLGETLANFNASGNYYPSNLFQNFTFDRTKGRWRMLKANYRHEARLDPEIASSQFRDLPAHYNKELLTGMVGGYARRSYQVIDPLYPGYTDAFLANLVNGPLLSITKPRKIQLHLGNVLAHYGLKVTYELGKNSRSFSDIPRALQEVNDYDLIITTIVLILARLDVSQWINRIEKINQNQAMPKILGTLYRRENISSWDGFIADLFYLKKKQYQYEELISYQPAPIRDLLGFLEQFYGTKRVPQEDVFGEGLKLLKNTLATLVQYKVLDGHTYLEALIDGMDYLAQEADRQGDTMNSISLAQSATILLQLLSQEPTGMEERLSRSEMQSYSWDNLTVNSIREKDNLLKNYLPLNYVAYNNSRSKTYLQCFSTAHNLFIEEKVSNHLWTALWCNRRLQRDTLIFLHELSSQLDAWRPEQKQHYFLLLKDAFQSYVNGQHKFSDALVSYQRPNQIRSHYTDIFTGLEEEDAQNFLNVERKATMKFHKVLQADILDGNTFAALKELVVAIHSVK